MRLGRPEAGSAVVVGGKLWGSQALLMASWPMGVDNGTDFGTMNSNQNNIGYDLLCAPY